MYGINLLEVAKILGATAVSNILFNKYGAIRSIHQEIVKYSAQQNIAMVKVMVRTLAQQNEQAYKDIVKNLTLDEIETLNPTIVSEMKDKISEEIKAGLEKNDELVSLQEMLGVKDGEIKEVVGDLTGNKRLTHVFDTNEMNWRNLFQVDGIAVALLEYND